MPARLDGRMLAASAAALVVVLHGTGNRRGLFVMAISP